MKDAYPVQTAECMVVHKLSQEPAFKWWISHVLRRRQRIVEKLGKKKYWRRTHKYGIELPKSVAEAMEKDTRTGTTFWRDAIEK
jgi:Zn-dependent M32 family carboxypeptidase